MPNEKPIYVKLFMGEQDGYDTETLTVNGRFPEHVYVHRICDNGRVAEAQRVYADDPMTAQAVCEALAVLCYQFEKADPKDGVTGGKQYLYKRCPARDRALTDPAL